LLARQQVVQQHAERVHIGDGADPFAAHLLGARKARSPEALVQPGLVVELASPLGIEQLRDAEIEQLGRAVGRHQDVGRLDVAVDDQVLVRVLNGRADLLEESQPLLRPQVLALAIEVEADAIDIFHHQVRHALPGRAAVQQAGDVRVVEVGEDLPLGAKATRQRVARQSAVDELDCDLLAKLLVRALGEINSCHSAATQRPHHTIATDELPRLDVIDDHRRPDRLVDALGEPGVTPGALRFRHPRCLSHRCVDLPADCSFLCRRLRLQVESRREVRRHDIALRGQQSQPVQDRHVRGGIHRAQRLDHLRIL
jgi:hypothetical protein